MGIQEEKQNIIFFVRVQGVRPKHEAGPVNNVEAQVSYVTRIAHRFCRKLKACFSTKRKGCRSLPSGTSDKIATED